jgi:hypothetical protein
MSEITKEEIAIMIDVQSKTVINLEKIATALKDIVTEQKAITETQTHLKEELQGGEVKKKLDSMHLDIVFTKYLFSAVGAIVIISAVILQVIK